MQQVLLARKLLSKNLKIVVDYNGDVLASFSPKEYADYVNQLVKQKAYITVQKKVKPRDEIEWMYQKLERLRTGKAFMIFVIDKKSKKLVGMLELIPYEFPFDHNCELSVSVRKEYRGLGLGTKMIKKAIKLATKLGYENIYLYVSKKNKEAISLYKKLGFKEIAVLKKGRNHYGKYVDELLLKYD